MLSNFDRAFLSKVKAWFSNTIYANTAIIYNIAYNLADGQTGAAGYALQFPLISIYRPSGFELDAMQTFAARRSGMDIVYSEDKLRLTKARMLVANLKYQLDIYTKSQEDLNTITVNLMQAFTLDPMLVVTQTDPASHEDYVESYEITYNNGPVEESEFQNGDRIYHYALVYEIKTARLLTFADVNTVRELQTEINDGEDERQYATNLVFDGTTSVSSTANLFTNIGKAVLDQFILGAVYFDSQKALIDSIAISVDGHTISFLDGGAITILPDGQVINDASPFTIVDDEETTMLIILKKE